MVHRSAIGAAGLAAGLILAFIPPLFANASGKLDALRPLRTDTPPRIDGVLDDEVWKTAPHETGFKTWTPDFGKTMSAQTIVYYAYDRENLYFAFRCFDPDPAKIKASVSGRDTITADDWTCLNLDTFDDQQGLYALYVNPLGIQADSRFEGNKEDYSVDVVWFSEGRIDAEGYAVEIRIPFKSIRYARNEPVEMGIIFERRISRLSEQGTYPPLDPAQGPNFLTQTRPLFFEGIRHYTLLELLPAVTYGRTSALEEGNLRAGPGRSDLSLTGKFGLTSQLILDGTINPDFSQVESDAGQVDFNQRFALYYPEKRPFFLEGQEKFNFAASNEGDPLGAIVHTRTIIDPLTGVKINGKLGPRDAVASIYALDELPNGGPDEFANFLIIRYKHALSQDGYLGGFATGRFDGGGRNLVGGTDGLLRLNPSSTFGYHAFFSGTKSGQGAPDRTGHAFGAQYDYGTRNLIVSAQVLDLGRDFDTQVGYLTRTGLTRFKIGAIPMIYPRSRLFLRIDPLFHVIQTRDKWSGLWETLDSFDLRVLLPRNTTLLAGAKYATEVYLGRRFQTSGVRVRVLTLLTKQLTFQLSGNYGRKIRYVEDPYQGRGTDATAALIYLPSDRLNLGLTFTYSDFTRNTDGKKEFDYTILRGRTTYQVNKYLFFRAIAEYNSFRERLTTDLLASFTYIPGTVIHIGYGSAYEKIEWREDQYAGADRFLETRRGFFFKASYLWRL
jgi:hypothetical protein